MVINATNDIEPPAATVPQGRARLIDNVFLGEGAPAVALATTANGEGR